MENNQKHHLLTYLINFVILGATFYFTCTVFAIYNYGNLLLQSLVYAVVVLACMRLGRLIVAILSLARSRIIYTVMVNAMGLVLGAVLLLLLGLLFPDIDFSYIAILVSSIIAFFILGTLSPLILCDRRMSTR